MTLKELWYAFVKWLNIYPRIVQFSNGSFAVRRGNSIFGYEYKSLLTRFWWSEDHRFAQDCVTYDLDKIKQVFETIDRIHESDNKNKPIINDSGIDYED